MISSTTSTFFGLSTTSAPMRDAIARRSSLTSVEKIVMAPLNFATATANCPIGPAPATRTRLPATLCRVSAWTPMPKGS